MIVSVQFTMTTLPDATDEEIQEWLDFELGYLSYLPGNNPLRRKSLCANRTATFQVYERNSDHDY